MDATPIKKQVDVAAKKPPQSRSPKGKTEAAAEEEEEVRVKGRGRDKGKGWAAAAEEEASDKEESGDVAPASPSPRKDIVPVTQQRRARAWGDYYASEG